MATQAPTRHTCAICNVEKETKGSRMPRGWHRHENLWCANCWKEAWTVKAIAMRVASPGGGWEAFREVMKEQWAASTQVANFITTQCYIRDVRRSRDLEKLPPMPNIYLYPELRAEFPEVSSQAVASMEQDYKAKYRAKRYKVLWTAEESLPNYRYPEPAVIHNAAWRAYYENESPHVSLRLGNERWELRLAGSRRRYARQLDAFKLIEEGIAIPAAAAVYRKRAGSNGDLIERDNGGQRARYDIMVKMVAWFPKPQWTERSGVLVTRTDSDSLIVALNAKDEKLWIYNADHLRRWVSEHRRQLQRWSDDQKLEDRPVADFQSRRTAAVTKYRRRIDNVVNQAAARIVNYAKRRRMAEIKYDDSDKSYVERFPWHQLKQRLQVLCDEHQLTLTLVEPEPKQEAALESAAG